MSADNDELEAPGQAAQAVIFESLVRLHGTSWDNDDGRAELADVAARVVGKSWCQALALDQIRELSSMKRWDWYRWADPENAEEEAAMDLQTLVRRQMEATLMWLAEDGWKQLDDYNDMIAFADDVQLVRELGKRYDIDPEEVWADYCQAVGRRDTRRTHGLVTPDTMVTPD